MYEENCCWRMCVRVCFFPFRYIHYILWGDFQFYSIIFFYSLFFFAFYCCSRLLLLLPLACYVRICLCILYLQPGGISSRQAGRQAHIPCTSALRHRYWHRQQLRAQQIRIYRYENVERIILAHEYVYGDGFSFRI